VRLGIADAAWSGARVPQAEDLARWREQLERAGVRVMV